MLRPRTLLYTGLWSLVGVGLVFALFIRSDIDMTVAPVRNPTFVTLSDGSIRNVYEVRLRNKHGEERPFVLSVKGDPTRAFRSKGRPTTRFLCQRTPQNLRGPMLCAPKGSDAANRRAVPISGFGSEDLLLASARIKDTVFNGKGTDGPERRSPAGTCSWSLLRHSA